MSRRIGAATAAALAVVCLLAVFLPPARAATPASLERWEAYSAVGSAGGVEASPAVRPFILLDSIGVAAVPYARSGLYGPVDPESKAIASIAYPTDFFTGAGFGDRGAPGTVIALYPKYPEEENHDLSPYPAPGSGEDTITQGALRVMAGHRRARARLDRNDGLVEQGRITIALPNGNPLLVVEGVTLKTVAEAGERIAQESVATAASIDIVGGAVRLENVRSVARTVSDGVTATVQAAMTIGAVTVGGPDGKRRAARLDDRGLHVEDPDQPQSVNQSLARAVSLQLQEAGVSIRTGPTSKVTQGARAEANVGGIVVESEQDAGDVRVSERVGLMAVSSSVSAVALAPLPPPSGELVPLPDPGFPPITTQPGPAPVAAAPVGETGTTPQQPVQPLMRGPMYGLVANMPDAALAGLGAALLVLAVGLGLVPSFRR